jgi:uncharacterized membrane protein (UPF0127 family)
MTSIYKKSILALSLTFAFVNSAQEALAVLPTVKLGDQEVKLEVAASKEEIENGLMFRTSMPETQGMVFLFHPHRQVAFWMYHTLIPLDMLFIRNGKIVAICKQVPPCKSEVPTDCPTYPVTGMLDVSEVVEVNGGFCDRHGVKEGDAIQFDFSSK